LGGRRGAPHRRQVRCQPQNLLAFLRGDVEALGALSRRRGRFEFLELLACLMPTPLEGACHQPVVGIDGLILPFRRAS